MNNLPIKPLGSVLENQNKYIEKAIKYLEISLCQVSSDFSVPTEWFDWLNMTRKNVLTSISFNNISVNQIRDFDMGIQYLRQSLELDPRSSYPLQWANIQVSLAIIFSEKIIVQYLDNIRAKETKDIILALRHYEQALEVYTPNQFPQEWARINLNIGTYYYKSYLLKNEELDELDNEYLDLSIKHYTLALSKLVSISEQAMTYRNLAIIYKYKDISKSIYYCQKALEKYSNQEFSLESAKIKSILGDCYQLQKQNQKAITSYQSALEFFKPNTQPIECLSIAYKLSSLTFKIEYWDIAIQAYNQVIDSIEIIRLNLVTDIRRQNILIETIKSYENLIIACLKLDQIEQAFETAERYRCKYLVDLMLSLELNQNKQISSLTKQYIQQYENLQKEINQLFLSQTIDNSLLSQYRKYNSFIYQSKILNLEEEKYKIWLKIRELDPVLAGEIKVNPLNINQIRKLITNSSTAIINIYSSLGKTYIFILTQEQISCHIGNHQNTSLQNFIYENWLKLYIKEHSKWCNQLPDLLSEISEKLAINKLIENHLQEIKELIIIPHIYLHLIPLAALPINNQETLGDRFLIRYAPSCQILEFCMNRPNITDNLNYGLIENATEDLPCTDFEGQKIAEIFKIPDSQRLKGSEQATIKNYRNLTEKVNILHSSHHAESRLDNPLESHLKLADGNITLGQLLTPNWRIPNISDVFLSCCETNLGLTEITDDILTLATGFLCAGARSVISTLWAVDDLATAIFAIIYYQNRQQGFNRVESLQKSQIQLRTMTGEDLASNYQSELKKILTEKLEKSYTNCQQIKKQKSQLPEDSLERKNLDRKYEQLDKQYKQIGKTRTRLDDICKQDYPFENPVYWAAFVIHGLS